MSGATVLAACAVCGATDIEAGVLGSLSRCRRCGHLFCAELPAGSVAELYGERYFDADEYLDYKSQRRTLTRNFQAYLRLMRAHGAERGRLLEVGAAYGFFLAEARASFEVTGIDVCAAPTAHGREALGLDLQCGDFLSLAPSAPYDVVCLWDTIEHLAHPEQFLAKAAEVLRPSGHLFLTTGDIGSPLARLRGQRWRQIHPPTHLHYFSRGTMRRLLERTGFRVAGTRAVGAYRSLGNVLHGVSLFGRQPLVRRGARWLRDRIGDRWGGLHLYLNLSDVMFVAARRLA